MSENHTYGNAFALWRKAAKTPWQAYTRHGFVQGLGDGTLPKSAYLHYLKQDYILDLLHNRLFLCEEVPGGIIL